MNCAMFCYYYKILMQFSAMNVVHLLSMPKSLLFMQVTASSRKIAVIAQRFCNLLGLIFRSAFESKNDM